MIPTRKLVNIRYMKRNNHYYDDGDLAVVTEQADDRTVIPTFVPNLTNFKAVDVSELSEEARAEMLKLLEEYHQYYTDHAKAIFNFEDWVEHSQGKKMKVKWRTFKLDQTELLD